MVKVEKKEIQRSCDSRALKRNSFSFVLQEQLFHRHATFTFNQNIAVAQLQHQQKQIAEQTQKSWMKKDNNNCGYTGSIPFKLCQRFFLMIARDILYEMSECFVVFQIFVAHLERRSIRFWWFCAHFNLLVFGEKIWWKDIFCFLFSGRFLKLFFGRISILFFCATISTYQQIISQNNRKSGRLQKKSFKRNFRQVHSGFITFLRSWCINLNQSEVQWIKAVKGTLLGDEVYSSPNVHALRIFVVKRILYP